MSIGNSKDVDPSISSPYMQKFMVQLSAGELDVVILDKSQFYSFVNEGMFLRLDNINGLNLDSIKREKIEAFGYDKKRAVYAINAKEIAILNKAGFNTENKVIGIIQSTKHKDNSILVFKWLLNK